MRSPNFGERRGGAAVSLIVLHYTAMQSCAAAAERLCDPTAEVSAHYLIDYDGTLLSLVDETARAWHAGAGEWAGAGDVNSRSIGIEIANNGAEPFGAPQMEAVIALVAACRARWEIPPEGVIGHSDMAPERKIDPGPRFDWQRLALEGQSVWPSLETRLVPLTLASPLEAQAFDTDLTTFGYPSAASEARLSAFRLRFAPWRKGPLTLRDCAEVRDLACRFSVDARRHQA